MDDARHVLTQFGFTALESEIYTFLLQESPVSGYRIAQALGKPAANTYKAIQTLEKKGALMTEEGETRLCRPVPSEELLERLAATFQASRKEAAAALAKFGEPAQDDRIYVVRSNAQAMHQTRRLIVSAQKTVSLATTEALRESFSEELAEAEWRQVRVRVSLVRNEEIRLACDALHCLLWRNESALVSSNPAFSQMIHDGLVAEYAVEEVQRRLDEGASTKRIQRALREARSDADAD